MLFCPDFNPRSREGSDFVLSAGMFLKKYFNPRSREGSDSVEYGMKWLQKNFNPRSREGSDLKRAFVDIEIDTISIHAPARGATCRHSFGTGDGEFQSTLPRGERH